MMAGRQAEVALRKNYFEDTLMVIGEFEMMGHKMNYVLKVSSFGSRSDGHNLQVYFGLLDDTMREFSESRYVYDSDSVIVDPQRLWIRAENVEINETFQGLKVYVKDEAITLDFVIKNDGNKMDLRTLEQLEINNRVEGYAYPYCTTEGTALIGSSYCDVYGDAYYVRRFQNRPGRFDRRSGQTSLLRGFSRAEAEPDEEAFSLYGIFILSNGRRIIFGTFGNGRNQDDIFILNSGNVPVTVKLNPIQDDIRDIERIVSEETTDEDGKVKPAVKEIDKDVTLRIEAADQSFMLKGRRVLTLTKDLSPERDDFKLYDRFARLAGTFDGAKIHGFGIMIMT